MAWLTVAAVESRGQETYSSDPRVDDYIADVESLIEELAGPQTSASYTHITEWDGAPRVWLPVRPVTALDSLSIDGTAVADLTDYRVHQQAAVTTATSYGVLASRRGALLEIGYTAGPAAAPSALIGVGARIVRELIHANQYDQALPAGVVAESLEGWSIRGEAGSGVTVSPAELLTDGDRALLASYRARAYGGVS